MSLNHFGRCYQCDGKMEYKLVGNGKLQPVCKECGWENKM